MFALRIECSLDEADIISAELWDRGAVALSESEKNGNSILIAGFADEESRDYLLAHFEAHDPAWYEDNTDWVRVTEDSWPPRSVGERLFLAAPWRQDPTPPGRIRILHNPGLASGTGEHPCTQLAAEALENCIRPGTRVLDVGTGSGILSIAAIRLGADMVVGIDPDNEALQTARENFALNQINPLLVAGSADAIIDGFADITVANISGTVLMSILDDLLRVTRPGGILILSGFVTEETTAFLSIFPDAQKKDREGWSSLMIQTS